MGAIGEVGRLFGRKKKEKHILRIWDAAGSVLYDGEPNGFALPEAEVLRLSERLFDDPEPCHIHRAAVHGRVWLELCEACEGRGVVEIEVLGESIGKYFAGYAGASRTEIAKCLSKQCN